jgi:hypothetical protein
MRTIFQSKAHNVKIGNAKTFENVQKRAKSGVKRAKIFDFSVTFLDLPAQIIAPGRRDSFEF